jgi:hypothetical protein
LRPWRPDPRRTQGWRFPSQGRSAESRDTPFMQRRANRAARAMALAQRGCEYRSGVAPQEKAPRRAGQSFWSHLLAQFLMLSRSRPGSQKERRAGACGARPERMARPFLSGRRQRAEPINLLRCLRPRELRSSRPCVAGKPHNCFKVVSRAKPDSPATPPKGREIRARVSPRIVIVTRARAGAEPASAPGPFEQRKHPSPTWAGRTWRVWRRYPPPLCQPPPYTDRRRT